MKKMKWLGLVILMVLAIFCLTGCSAAEFEDLLNQPFIPVVKTVVTEATETAEPEVEMTTKELKGGGVIFLKNSESDTNEYYIFCEQSKIVTDWYITVNDYSGSSAQAFINQWQNEDGSAVVSSNDEGCKVEYASQKYYE